MSRIFPVQTKAGRHSSTANRQCSALQRDDRTSRHGHQHSPAARSSVCRIHTHLPSLPRTRPIHSPFSRTQASSTPLEGLDRDRWVDQAHGVGVAVAVCVVLEFQLRGLGMRVLLGQVLAQRTYYGCVVFGGVLPAPGQSLTACNPGSQGRGCPSAQRRLGTRTARAAQLTILECRTLRVRMLPATALLLLRQTAQPGPSFLCRQSFKLQFPISKATIERSAIPSSIRQFNSDSALSTSTTPLITIAGVRRKIAQVGSALLGGFDSFNNISSNIGMNTYIHWLEIGTQNFCRRDSSSALSASLFCRLQQDNRRIVSERTTSFYARSPCR